MDGLTVDQVLDRIGARLHLSKETETELLREIRTHLDDAMAEAAAKGEDEHAALIKAAEAFGIEEASAELQTIHANHDSVDAILATALPVLFAIILRWIAYAPGGSVLQWRQVLTQPGFYIVSIAAIIIPLLCFRRWRFALIGWGIFWLLSVVFVLFPSINRW